MPKNRVSVMTKKVAKLQGLFDLLEKCLDAPAAPVEFDDARGGPVEVVRDENHLAILPFDLDQGVDQTKPFWVLFASRDGC